MQRFGVVERLWRYPVKSLKAESIERIRVLADGLEGDRTCALLVASGHERVDKPYRGKEHNLLHTLGSVSRAEEAARECGVTLRRSARGRFFDAGPVSVIVDTWVAELEELVGMALDHQRFRPNIYVRAEPGYRVPESALVGSLLLVGTATLRVVSEIHRCVTPTYDVVTGAPQPDVLRVLAKRRDNTMGVYCEVERTGVVALGDAATS